MKNTGSFRELVDIQTVNDAVINDVQGFVAHCEEKYKNNIKQVCEVIAQNPHYSIVLLAGPSGSGKTTTSGKISEGLSAYNINSIVISLDNFFLNKDKLPKLPDGSNDYESIHTLDIDCIRNCFDSLINTGTAELPYFDFTVGKRDLEASTTVHVGENDVVIIEGIHALNPVLTEGSFDKSSFFKIYVSTESQIVEDGMMVLGKRNLRLMRRLIRDYLFRNSSVENTLDMWKMVCEGEVYNIKPFKVHADAIIDTVHLYEPCIYHHYLLPLFQEVSGDSKYYSAVLELQGMLEHFSDIDKDIVPADSMLREFIGPADRII